ncbi:hypothetical protein DIPPA_29177 [Diplonema papillatum]|nr:hypothetical protein DIPPA_29177 [Diplonema papillatum]
MQLYTNEQVSSPTRRVTKEQARSQAAAVFGRISDEELEEEVERLVQWTRDLDYKAYRSDWLGLATTAGSDYQIVAPVT